MFLHAPLSYQHRNYVKVGTITGDGAAPCSRKRQDWKSGIRRSFLTNGFEAVNWGKVLTSVTSARNVKAQRDGGTVLRARGTQ